MPSKEDNVPATLRAVPLLEALGALDRPATLVELTDAVRLPKPTLYRMLSMLEAAGLAMREPTGRRYVVGPRLVALGRNIMLNGNLRSERRAILGRLVDDIGETCNFTMLDQAQVVYIDRVETAWPLRMTLSSGSRVPLHCTASGKLLLALLPKSSRDRIAAKLALNGYTQSTITDAKRFAAELVRIRGRRYATDNEEYHAGLVCVAVPVMNKSQRACAAIAIQAPVSRMPLEHALSHLPALRQAAGVMGSTLS